MPDAALTDWFPLDPAEHQRQLDALLAMLGGTPEAGPEGEGHVMDLGCGDGRIARPAARAGFRVLAIDCDPDALARCAAPNITTRLADALDPNSGALAPAAPSGRIVGAWCLGHTFMLFHDSRAALDLMRRLRSAIAPGGWFAIDAFCSALWADVAEGLWQTGVSEDGRWQLIWTPGAGDNTVALRQGRRVNPRDWMPGAGDRTLRLWSMGELALLAEASGWRPPRTDDSGSLLVFA